MKGSKHYKNGKKFLKASQRAFSGGKVINGTKFEKQVIELYQNLIFFKKFQKQRILWLKQLNQFSKYLEMKPIKVM